MPISIRRCRKPKTFGYTAETRTLRGRAQTPAETVLRLLLLKHIRNWSFDVLEREVTLNLAYREFTRVGLNKPPDAKTLARVAHLWFVTIHPFDDGNRRIARDRRHAACAI